MGLRYERQRDRGWQGGTVSLFLTTVDAACDFQLVRMKRRELLQRLQAASPQYREAAFVQMILRGIAFHHADLITEEREDIEAAYREQVCTCSFIQPSIHPSISRTCFVVVVVC